MDRLTFAQSVTCSRPSTSLDRLRRDRVGQQLAVFVGYDGYAVGAGFVPGKQLGKPTET